ncbi:MAG: serine/threonine-protein kinase, partial [Balneolaceae bacterium]|nr:serine/threonine-protein kinase [Balneolaceae bacterium]
MQEGSNIQHYKILEKIGEGGMGVVYKARDTKLDRIVALKFLPPHLTKSKKDKQRFIREAKSAAALNHPNICTIYSVDEFENRQFISMEYIDGDTLKNKLETEGLDVRSALEYIIQVAEALSKAHGKGIIHRDIKPSNIMINKDGNVKVMDFGLAKVTGSNPITQTETTVGTVAYMSPEQIQAKEIDHRADLFSLGVVLFEMLTGERPFKGQYDAALTYSIANEDPPLLSDLKPELPKELANLVNQLLEKDPEDRYPSAEELLDDLETSLEQLSGSFTSTTNSIEEKTEESTSQAPHTRQASQSESSSSSDSTSITINIPPLRSRNVMAGLSAGLLVLILLGWWLVPFTHSPDSTSENSIAVLPLESVSPDSGDVRFTDGVHEELINRLAGIRDLKVIARSSVLGYSPGERDLQAIAEELDVSSLMEGT